MRKTIAIIWGVALVIYLAFLGWHENWRGPLTASEIETYMEQINANEELNDTQRKTLKAFMENDTGGSFYMVNFLAYPPYKVSHPKSGDLIEPPALLQEYFQPFIGTLLSNAGYPALTGPVVGDYIEAWGVEADPGWQGAGLIRYRSRRDLLDATTNPVFSGVHIYKRAALAITFASPIERTGGVLLSPTIAIGLLLALLAALAQIFYMREARR